MKKWICGMFESPFFFGVALCGLFFICEASILIPWVFDLPSPLTVINAMIWSDTPFAHKQELVNAVLGLTLLSAPSAALLCMVRPDVGEKPNDIGPGIWIGRMYDKYYTVGFRVVYSMLNLAMLILVASQVGNVFNEPMIKQLLVMSLVFTITTSMLCGLYYWAINGTKNTQPSLNKEKPHE